MSNKYSLEFKEQDVKRVLAGESEIARYMYMEANCSKYQLAKMAQWLNVSRSGYYAWRKRHPSLRDIENQQQLEKISKIMRNTGRYMAAVK